MNRLNIQQTGGFPLTTNTLDFLQSSLLLMQEFGNIAGDLAIIRGCEVNGTQVSNGVVYINGEVLPFEGGTIGTNVIIKETATQKPFEDGIAKDVEIRRVARYGNGSTTYAWSDFSRIKPIKVLQKSLTPVGLISMWAGSTDAIPEGWHLCNGENGTPDLRDKFVLGSNGADTGEDGGSHEVKLEEVNMPPHSHSISISYGGEHYHDIYNYHGNAGLTNGNEQTRGNFFYGELGNGNYQSKNGTKRAGSHTHSASIGVTGGLNEEAVPIDNRPKFYKIAFIMYIG